MASVAGIQVGVGHILVTPQLAPNFGSNLNGAIGQHMTTAGRDGGTRLASSLSSSVDAGPVRARFGLIGKGMAAAVVGGFAAAGIAQGIGKIVSTGFDEVKDYQAGFAKLNAGLKSTGNQAGLSATQMEDLASKIEGYSGQTDDSIVSTEQLLLTFTNIKDVAGAGNDVFSQTTSIAADMAARLGGDASGAAIQLGKALNDPIKGVTALSRVGVSFDEGQKKTIKTLVESGNTLGAQKIILGELNKEFGGSAKAVGNTLPGQIERAKRSFEGLSQSVVTAALPAFTAVVPALTSAVQWLGPKLESGVKIGVDAIGKLGKAAAPALDAAKGGIKAFVGAFKAGGDDVTSSGFAGALERVGLTARKVFDSIKTVVGSAIAQIRPLLSQVGTFLQTTLLPAFSRVADTVRANVVPVLQHLADIFVQKILPTVRTVAGVIIHDFLPVLVRVWESVQQALIPALAKVARVIIDVVGSAFTHIRDVFIEHRAQIQHIITIAGDLIQGFAKVAGWIIQHLVPVLGFILKGAFDIVTTAIGVVITAVGWLITIIGKMGVFFVGVARVVIDIFKAVADTVLSSIIVILGAASHLPFVGSKFAGLRDGVRDFKTHFDTDMHGAVDTMNTAKDGINAAVDGINPHKTITIDAQGKFLDAFNANPGTVGPQYASLFSASLNANGNLYEQHHAQIAPGGAMRVWAEPETGGEAYIPLAASKRSRSLGIWAQTGALLGVQGFAEGGLTLGRFGRNLPAYGDYVANAEAQHLAGLWKTHAQQVVTSAANTGGAGVARWAPLVLQVLAMLGQSASYLPNVLRQINTESGGNPGITQGITDINSILGQRAQGLLQVIPPTFAAYAGPFAGLGPFNPLASIYAGLNYATHRYGDLSVLGQGHGYANGGIARGWSVVGERGPELINAGSAGSRVLSHGDSVAALGGRPGMFAGANVTIGDTVDLDAAQARHDWEMRRGTF